MKGTRPLDNDEIRQVSACFTGTFEARNRGYNLSSLLRDLDETQTRTGEIVTSG